MKKSTVVWSLFICTLLTAMEEVKEDVSAEIDELYIKIDIKFSQAIALLKESERSTSIDCFKQWCHRFDPGIVQATKNIQAYKKAVSKEIGEASPTTGFIFDLEELSWSKEWYRYCFYKVTYASDRKTVVSKERFSLPNSDKLIALLRAVPIHLKVKTPDEFQKIKRQQELAARYYLDNMQ